MVSMAAYVILVNALGEQVLAANMQRDLRFLENFSTDRMTFALVTLSKCRITRSSFGIDVFTDSGGHFYMMSGDIEIHDRSCCQIVLRLLTGGMLSDSRYLATVRLYNHALLAR